MIHNVLSTKEATFKEIEDNFSFCFPEDYKSFLTKYNGVNMEDYYETSAKLSFIEKIWLI